MRHWRRTGESMLECVILLISVIVVLIFAGRAWFSPRVEQMVSNEGNMISTSSDKWVTRLGT